MFFKKENSHDFSHFLVRSISLDVICYCNPAASGVFGIMMQKDTSNVLGCFHVGFIVFR